MGVAEAKDNEILIDLSRSASMTARTVVQMKIIRQENTKGRELLRLTRKNYDETKSTTLHSSFEIKQ